MIKLIIFDVGGVIDTFDEVQYIAYISKKLRIDPMEFRSTLIPMLDEMEIGKVGLSKLLKTLSKHFKVSEERLEWDSAFRRLNKVNYGIVDLIGKLSKSYKIAVLTNVSRSRHEVKMETYLKKVKYDRIFTSFGLKMRKPEHSIYLYVLKKMNAKPQETLFIDNLRINTDGAKELGINTIQYKNYRDLVKRLGKIGVGW